MFKKTIAVAGVSLLLLSPLAVQAAPDNTTIPNSGVGELKSNLQNFGAGTGLANAAGESDLKGTIANIINIVLGFLGIIAVVMLITGGYQWMMAGGNDETVKEAKNRIKNAVIGLVIVFAAYIIVNFAVRQISNATGAGGGPGGGLDRNAEGDSI